MAAVLAHELGHLVRDHWEYERRAMGVFQYNAQIAARVEYFRTQSSREAIRVGSLEYHRQRFAFSREQEKDADSHGTVLLTRAGFKPTAMVKYMARMANDEFGRRTKWTDTHPGAGERLALVEPRAYDEEIDQLARSLAQEGEFKVLAFRVNEWISQMPDSGNAWFHKAAFLERLRAATYVEGYERALSRTSPGISRTDAELGGVWESLCIGLYRTGNRIESAHCSLFIKDSEARARFREATFGENLFMGGGPQGGTALLTARDADGSKILTNDPTILKARGLPATQNVAPWRAIRFPPSELDRPLPSPRNR
jgi:peptidase M48-like protein